jgi:hypothetical protein
MNILYVDQRVLQGEGKVCSTSIVYIDEETVAISSPHNSSFVIVY